MAWGTPPTWATGNVVTAAKLTIISDDLNYLKPPYDPWPTWTPVITQTSTRAGTTGEASYVKQGRWLHGSCRWTSTVAGSAAVLSVSYPGGFTPNDTANNPVVGYGYIYNGAVVIRAIVAALSTGFAFYTGDAALAQYSVALASGHAISFNFDYQSAT